MIYSTFTCGGMMLDLYTKTITTDDVNLFVHDLFPEAREVSVRPDSVIEQFTHGAVYFKHPNFFGSIRLSFRIEKNPTSIIFDHLQDNSDHFAFISNPLYQFYNKYYRTDQKLDFVELKYFSTQCNFRSFEVIKSFTKEGEKLDFNLCYSITNKLKDRTTNRLAAKFTDLHFIVSQRGVVIRNDLPSTFLNFVYNFKEHAYSSFIEGLDKFIYFQLDDMMINNISSIAHKNILLMIYFINNLGKNLPDISVCDIYNITEERVLYYINFLETLDSVDDI